MSERREQATLGGGCFWCLEAVFNRLKGVVSAISGYAGGKRPNPTYEQVCAGVTGHAEVVQVTYDPDEISYEELLEVFFTLHDPTQLNRQGNDVGTQYRSVVFTHSPEQERQARDAIAAIERDGLWDGKVVTQVEPLTVFYRAEDYHQDYFTNNGATNSYCQFVVAPKVAKARQKFASKLRA